MNESFSENLWVWLTALSVYVCVVYNVHLWYIEFQLLLLQNICSIDRENGVWEIILNTLPLVKIATKCFNLRVEIKSKYLDFQFP